MIKPYCRDSKRFLGALTTTEQGVYEIIPLTKSEGFLTFPVEPICDFYEIAGQFYMENFIIKDNLFAFNKNHLSGFGYADLLDEPKNWLFLRCLKMVLGRCL